MITQDLQNADSKSPLASATVRDPKKWEVAQQFESMFMEQMFKSMRQTVPESGLTEESNGRRIFTEMLDSEMSKVASRQHSMGLADLVYRQLVQEGGNSETRVPTSQWNASYSAQSRPARADEDLVNQLVQEAASANQIDPALLRSLVQQESGGDSTALSNKGAMGLTQLMKGTAKDMGVENPWDARQNLMGGARYLKKMLVKFDGREDLALAAYNAGPGAVEKHGGIPPYEETRKYVQKVLDGRKRYNTEV